MSNNAPKGHTKLPANPAYPPFKKVPQGPQGPAYDPKSFPKQKEAPAQYR
jgi:hypothetical protein